MMLSFALDQPCNTQQLQRIIGGDRIPWFDLVRIYTGGNDGDLTRGIDVVDRISFSSILLLRVSSMERHRLFMA